MFSIPSTSTLRYVTNSSTCHFESVPACFILELVNGSVRYEQNPAEIAAPLRDTEVEEGRFLAVR